MLDIDLTTAATTDKLADTVGYDQVVDRRPAEPSAAKRYRLVGGRRRRGRRRGPRTLSAGHGVRITVHKPHAPVAATFADVGVSILTRARHG